MWENGPDLTFPLIQSNPYPDIDQYDDQEAVYKNKNGYQTFMTIQSNPYVYSILVPSQGRSMPKTNKSYQTMFEKLTIYMKSWQQTTTDADGRRTIRH